MNLKKLSILLFSSLLVAACSGSNSQTRSDLQPGSFQPPATKTPQSQGSTNNAEARKAFQSAIDKINNLKLDEDKVQSTSQAAVKAPSATEKAALTPAEQALTKAVKSDPNFGKAWFNLGVIRERLGKKEEAKDAYLKAIQASPHLGAPHVNLGMMNYDETKDPDSAIPFFKDAIAANEFDTDAHSNLSAVYRLDKNYEEAANEARYSLAGDSQNLNAYANLARANYEAGHYDIALLVCLNALKIQPDRPDIINISGLIWLKKGDVTEGIKQFKNALKVDPNYVPALMNLGAVMLNVRNYDEAIKLFDKVSQVDPNNLEAKISAAVAYRSKGDLKKAQEIYDAVEKVDPKNPVIAYNQGVLEQEQYAQNAQKGVDGPPAPEDPIAAMDWQIENIKRSIEHYKKAIDHYNDYLAWEKPSKTAEREEAQKRIEQVGEIIKMSADQIPQLEAQKQEIAEDLKQQQAEAQGQQSGDDQSSGDDSADDSSDDQGDDSQ